MRTSNYDKSFSSSNGCCSGCECDSIGDCGAGGSTGGDVESYGNGDWYQNGNSSMLLYIFIMFSCNEIRIAQPCIWSDIN